MKVLISLPAVVLYISGYFLILFKSEIRDLLNRVSDGEAFGVKVAFRKDVIETAQGVAAQVAANVALQPERDAANQLPEEARLAKLADIREQEAVLIQKSKDSLQAEASERYEVENQLSNILNDPDFLSTLGEMYWYAKMMVGDEDDAMVNLRRSYPRKSEEELQRVYHLAKSEMIKRQKAQSKTA
ncbi:hypothetical protein I2I05_20490 [Hymenobacter sp. BT683]|uniref:Uncharacterized protein n=2 Tax=Hymenobacter jeongseonensis TaxID=2791027 RepID=A0ABS0IN36_9BACT|nr:hypothetical protein [Hymenobacter jeongseonensis]